MLWDTQYDNGHVANLDALHLLWQPASFFVVCVCHFIHLRVFVYVSPAHFAPSRICTRLRYAVFSKMNNAGSQVANNRYQPTYAYDVDPALGSTAMPGFSEYAGLYRFYRVQAAKIVVRFCNEDTTLGAWCYITATNYDPGSNHVVGTTTSQLGQPQTKSVLLGSSAGGHPVAVMKAKATTASFAGAWDGNILDNYCAPTSGASSPANNWFFDVGVYTTAVMTNGVGTAVTMEVDIEFFEFTNPSS